METVHYSDEEWGMSAEERIRKHTYFGYVKELGHGRELWYAVRRGAGYTTDPVQAEMPCAVLYQFNGKDCVDFIEPGDMPWENRVVYTWDEYDSPKEAKDAIRNWLQDHLPKGYELS